MGSQAQWAPDPYRRHRLRFWDGDRWTEYVLDDGAAGVDPVPAPQLDDIPAGYLFGSGREEPSSPVGGGEDGSPRPGRSRHRPALRGRRVAR